MADLEKKAPELRFKGFVDDWEQRKLGETNTKFTDGNYGESYPSNKDMSDSTNGVPFLRGSDLKNGKLDVSNANYITKEKHNELTSGHLTYDDIVIAVRGSLGSLGYVDVENVDWNINSQLAVIRTEKREFIGTFLIQFLSSDKGRKELLSRTTGTALKQLPIKQVKDVPVPKPSIDEQQKIGSFFKQLDDTIALHQRKLSLLKQLKQTYLQAMFPQGDEIIPALRIAGFSDPWEQRKLGEVLDNQYNGQTPSRAIASFWNGNIDWLSSGELNRGVVSETIEKITEEGRQDANLKFVPKGTFVMAITGLEAVGTRGNCAILGMDTTLNQSCMALFPNKQLLNSSFLFQWYRKVGEEYGLQYTQGTKQQSYNAELLKILPIFLPSVKEQVLIADFFGKIDATISFHQSKIQKFVGIKKVLLAKMFV